MTTYTLGRDINGNKTLRVSVPGARAFTIQTNGNLPKTHRDGVSPSYTPSEVSAYVRAYGTAKQRDLLNLK
jgi:hypothetical protein